MSPEGPREPGVGSEQAASWSEKIWDLEKEMEKCELRSIGSLSIATSSAVSEDDLDIEPIQEVNFPDYLKDCANVLNKLIISITYSK